MFCSPSLGCYNIKLEMMKERERERKRAFDDFDPLDYHGPTGAKKAKKEIDPAGNPNEAQGSGDRVKVCS